MDEKKERKIITHQPNFQTSFVRSNVDFAVGGSAMGVGKTYAALLMAAEPSLDPEFRMLCVRENLQQSKAGGGMVDEAMKIYGGMATLKMSDNPRITFGNSSFIDFTHMNDQTPDKVLERIRGWQYSVIYIDEGTNMEWSTIRLMFSRNRGSGGWTGKFRLTCNPKKSHWLRIWCDWWIDPVSGFIIPERDGVVRYFYIKGEKINDVIFGGSKEEVYDQCAYQINRILEKMNSTGDNYSYKDVIKSTTLYSGKLSDNKKLLQSNPGYIGSVAAMGEKQSLANLNGSWNVDEIDESEAPITQAAANEVFMNDEQTNGDNWITVDLADKGTDNLVALVWNGLHVIDKLILSRSTPRENAERTQLLAAQHKIGDSHIIFDGTAAAYFNDYIPEAIPYISNKATIGLYGRMAMCLKDECYLRLVEMIKHGRITIAESVGQARYYHENLKQEITIQTEFCEECSVVRFKEVGGGRKRLMNKKEMNAMLGKGRSMDILDACAMRMYPLLEFPYGEELESTRVNYDPNKDEEERLTLKSIYDPSTWA